ncbi:transcriptional regulator, TetR family [Streptomyces sp. DvalAA-14]|uniref:TetR/AcrR family transcriptional regulator n=1 Tax=unclassified Streptomyces TaxID=2593676 RepID=UPI00081B5F6B|nr:MULTISPECIES: TetR/AcrR family transcriptional regulator [unclassified Streptomyces]MYS24859.1 TetR family transcriptional regulator [Streptomyces sp. SID4948]SCE50030.1 transcriptional regulator, TetR family [Streptomyces sp. DvalAA-14]
MPKVTQQYMDARREEILDAARRCFLRDGFHSTSMQDLFAESGLSAGAVYRHFASKDEMILAIAEENLRAVLQVALTVAEREPGRSVGAVLAETLEVVRARSAERDLAGLTVLVWAEAMRNRSLAGKIDELLTRMRTALVAVVREHQGRGELPDEVTAEAIATTLLSILPGYLLQLAVLDPSVVAGVPDAVRAMWPAPQ